VGLCSLRRSLQLVGLCDNGFQTKFACENVASTRVILITARLKATLAKPDRQDSVRTPSKLQQVGVTATLFEEQPTIASGPHTYRHDTQLAAGSRLMAAGAVLTGLCARLHSSQTTSCVLDPKSCFTRLKTTSCVLNPKAASLVSNNQLCAQPQSCFVNWGLGRRRLSLGRRCRPAGKWPQVCQQWGWACSLCHKRPCTCRQGCIGRKKSSRGLGRGG
jgi:hypothetical protein